MSYLTKCGKFLRLSSNIASRRKCSTVSNKGLVLGVYNEDDKPVELTPSAEHFNSTTNGKLLEQINLVGEIKEGKSFLFWGVNSEFKSIAVVGLGSKNKGYNEIERIWENREAVRLAAAAGCKALQGAGVKEISIESMNDSEAAAEGSALVLWTFDEYKSKRKDPPTFKLYSSSGAKDDLWERGVIKANSQNLARKLMDTPGNLLTPTIFCENAQQIFNGLNVNVQVHDKKWAEEKKMFSFLSVARGSVEPPKFLELTYSNGSKSELPYVLIGKGVTFDSGGISIKPSASMDEMRGDMGGAACVVGALQGVAKLCLEKNVKVLIPLTENMPSSAATKPGDVVRAMNGKSICVNNTDAEGRLILADALCYSATFNPKWILDIATLTGAMRVAIGGGATGVFTNSNSMYQLLEHAGAATGDRVWQFPLWKSYTKEVTEDKAYDVNNIGKGRGAGACTAAAFLREFVPQNVDWMHLDMAGVMGPKDPTPYLSGMTGRPTRTLIDFISAYT